MILILCYFRQVTGEESPEITYTCIAVQGIVITTGSYDEVEFCADISESLFVPACQAGSGGIFDLNGTYRSGGTQKYQITFSALVTFIKHCFHTVPADLQDLFDHKSFPRTAQNGMSCQFFTIGYIQEIV